MLSLSSAFLSRVSFRKCLVLVLSRVPLPPACGTLTQGNAMGWLCSGSCGCGCSLSGVVFHFRYSLQIPYTFCPRLAQWLAQCPPLPKLSSSNPRGGRFLSWERTTGAAGQKASRTFFVIMVTRPYCRKRLSRRESHSCVGPLSKPVE